MRITGIRAAFALLVALWSGPLAAADEEKPALDLAAWKGQVVLLDFWASWCVPCRQSFPWMAALRRTYGARGLVVVTVNLDEDPEQARRFLASAPNDFVHLQDPEGRIARFFGVKVMPSSLLFDREGRPVYRHEGFHPDREPEYERHVTDLLESRGPSVALKIDAVRRPRLGVHAWERAALADRDMELVPDPMETDLDDHIYFSKEASSGGRGFGGGGCGCN